MGRGDHLRVNRGPYHHHGIDLGDGTIAHFSGEPFRKANATARRSSREEFERGSKIEQVYHQTGTLHPDHSCVSALGLIRQGAGRYNLFSNNCEHLATFCKTGTGSSQQVSYGLGWYGRRLHIALRSPEAAIALPIGDFALRTTKTAMHLARRVLESRSKSQVEMDQQPGFYRAGRWWQDERGQRFFQATTPGWWSVVDGSGRFRRCNQPSQPLGALYQSWLVASDMGGIDVLEAGNGWFAAQDGTWQPMPVSWTPGTNDNRMAHAPLPALNAYLEAASDLTELHLAINEIALRRPLGGDGVTYRALVAIAQAEVGSYSGEDLTMAISCRQTALWTLSALNAVQHAHLSCENLPGFKAIQWALSGGDGRGNTVVAGIHALGILSRPTDPVIHQALTRARDHPDSEVVAAAEKYLAEGSSCHQ
jgi:hypothetical protein